MKILYGKHTSYLGSKKNATVSTDIDKYYDMKENNNIVFQVSQSTSGNVGQHNLTDNTMFEKIILHQTIKIGDTNSVTLQLWMQLQMINSIKADIVNYRESNDPNDLVYEVASSRFVTSTENDGSRFEFNRILFLCFQWQIIGEHSGGNIWNFNILCGGGYRGKWWTRPVHCCRESQYSKRNIGHRSTLDRYEM